MITIQQKLFRLLKIFSPAMQDQKLASPVVASLQGEEQLVAAVLRPSHRVQAGSVTFPEMRGTSQSWKSLSF